MMYDARLRLGTLLACLTFTACLPDGGPPGGGGGAWDTGADTSVNNATPDVGSGDATVEPDTNAEVDAGSTNNTSGTNNTTGTNDANNTSGTNNDPQGQTCPDGSVIPADEPCDVCPSSIDDCADEGLACTTISFMPGSPCGTCTVTEVNQCGPLDGCCPAGCGADDGDCAGCGNGRTEAGETCDGNCPRGVNDCPEAPNACTTYIYSGSADACTAQCATQAVTACVDLDGCCPAGCSVNDDADCGSPPGDIGHGDTCVGNEAACQAVSGGTICVTSGDLSADIFISSFINVNGVCSPFDCANNPGSCRNGTTCTPVQGPIPLGGPVSLCLKPCAVAMTCDSGMTCTTVDLAGANASTFCF